jgi:3-oxoadipate enol-lactonase
MKQLQADLPGSRFIELPNAGHISNLDRPDMFNRAVEDFLREAAN